MRGDLGGGEKPALPAPGHVIEARVLDRDTGRGGQGDHDLLILFGEVAATLLLGQVEVAECLAADQDGHAQEGTHRRVVGRKAGGMRMLGEVVKPERMRLVDQQAEDSLTGRQMADVLPDLVADARRW